MIEENSKANLTAVSKVGQWQLKLNPTMTEDYSLIQRFVTEDCNDGVYEKIMQVKRQRYKEQEEALNKQMKDKEQAQNHTRGNSELSISSVKEEIKRDFPNNAKIMMGKSKPRGTPPKEVSEQTVIKKAMDHQEFIPSPSALEKLTKSNSLGSASFQTVSRDKLKKCEKMPEFYNAKYSQVHKNSTADIKFRQPTTERDVFLNNDAHYTNQKKFNAQQSSLLDDKCLRDLYNSYKVSKNHQEQIRIQQDLHADQAVAKFRRKLDKQRGRTSSLNTRSRNIRGISLQDKQYQKMNKNYQSTEQLQRTQKLENTESSTFEKKSIVGFTKKQTNSDRAPSLSKLRRFKDQLMRENTPFHMQLSLSKKSLSPAKYLQVQSSCKSGIEFAKVKPRDMSWQKQGQCEQFEADQTLVDMKSRFYTQKSEMLHSGSVSQLQDYPQILYRQKPQTANVSKTAGYSVLNFEKGQRGRADTKIIQSMNGKPDSYMYNFAQIESLKPGTKQVYDKFYDVKYDLIETDTGKNYKSNFLQMLGSNGNLLSTDKYISLKNQKTESFNYLSINQEKINQQFVSPNHQIEFKHQLHRIPQKKFITKYITSGNTNSKLDQVSHEDFLPNSLLKKMKLKNKI